MVVPIDQKAVTQAIQIDSKISKGLYNRLGEDVSTLKKSIRAEVSRGIANGSSWNEIGTKIAQGMRSTIDMFGFNKAQNNAIRVARTEGHRIQNQSALDAQKEAKKKGADILRQWDAALDGATREAHRMADGQIRELDEDFDVGGEKLKAPGIGGSAANVINCRCALLQRARWALDESELDTLKERAEYYGLDKTKDFEDYKEKYLKSSDQESVNVQKNSKGTSQEKALEKNGKSGTIGARSRNFIYENKEVYFDEEKDYTIKIPSYSDEVNDGLTKAAIDVAKKGTKDRYEHMHLVNLSTGISEFYETNNNSSGVGVDFWKIVMENPDVNYAFVHNHNIVSSLSETDLTTCITTQNIPVMIAVQNDGVIYYVERKKDAVTDFFPDVYFEKELEEINNAVRNGDITPAERTSKREEVIIESIMDSFFDEGMVIING